MTRRGQKRWCTIKERHTSCVRSFFFLMTPCSSTATGMAVDVDGCGCCSWCGRSSCDGSILGVAGLLVLFPPPTWRAEGRKEEMVDSMRLSLQTGRVGEVGRGIKREPLLVSSPSYPLTHSHYVTSLGTPSRGVSIPHTTAPRLLLPLPSPHRSPIEIPAILTAASSIHLPAHSASSLHSSIVSSS